MSSTEFSSSPPSVKEDQSPPVRKQQFSSSPPSVEENQPSPVRKQQLESDNNDGEAVFFDHATLLRMLDEEDAKKDKVYGDYIDGEREMTDKEIEQYCAAVNASDGFDVPSFPDDVCALSVITPIVLTDYFHEKLKPFCVAALKDYNEKKNTDYEFLSLEKANGQAVCGILYYLTFVGRIPKDNTTQIFEARVLDGIPKNIEDDATEVEFCREKASPSASDV